MPSQVTATIEKLKGRAKQKAGEMLDADRLAREGRAQQRKAAAQSDAAILEKVAREKRAEAARHAGEQAANAEA